MARYQVRWRPKDSTQPWQNYGTYPDTLTLVAARDHLLMAVRRDNKLQSLNPPPLLVAVIEARCKAAKVRDVVKGPGVYEYTIRCR